MKWGYWPECLLLITVALIQLPHWFPPNTQASNPLKNPTWTPQRKLAAREKTRELWYHGYDNYMTFAFPLDELTPLSCSGQGPDWNNPANVAANDVAGNFSLTLIDVLDTFVVLDDRPGFETAVKNIIEWVSFDVNTKPQVFETTIRVLGGLLSGHIFANSTDRPFYLPWYRGELLDLAYDLGKRLLPAFSTPTGLPYARINLRHGLIKGETLETCTAGAGSLILEFATLSRLTGDERFEKAAYKAFFGIWNRRSDIDLVGNTINTWNGMWNTPEITGIGAGIDSFFEYALKWYIMSGEPEFLDVWDDAYAAIMRYSRASDGYWYKLVNMNSGDVAYNTVDSLSAFWPGLQVLAGDVQSAIKLHLMYYNLWREHSGLPEVYDTNFKRATSFQYPLRPEFVESTWYLYRATRDPFYLDVGERILFDIITRAKVDCGLTGIQDLRTNKRDDRMESFALSETLKYLYLLFDEENPLHSDDSNYVFTTEGHILTLGREHLRQKRKPRAIENHQCPAYTPFISVYDNHKKETGLIQGVMSRPDVDYARELVGRSPNHRDMETWSPYGWCERPKVELYSYDFILSPSGKLVAEDLSPSLLKLGVLPDGYVINNVTGIRCHIIRRMDGKGYDIRKLGHYTIRPGQTVYVNDSSIFLPPGDDNGVLQQELRKRDPDAELHFFLRDSNPMFKVQLGLPSSELEEIIIGYTGFFGADLSPSNNANTKVARMSRPAGVIVTREPNNTLGCKPFKGQYPDSVMLVHRGECTFFEKLLQARAAGAAGVLVISNDNAAINPTANPDEVAEADDLSDSGIVLLTKSTGDTVLRLLNYADNRATGQLVMVVNPGHQTVDIEKRQASQEQREERASDVNRILYINGHPLLNTRLMF